MVGEAKRNDSFISQNITLLPIAFTSDEPVFEPAMRIMGLNPILNLLTSGIF